METVYNKVTTIQSLDWLLNIEALKQLFKAFFWLNQDEQKEPEAFFNDYNVFHFLTTSNDFAWRRIYQMKSQPRGAFKGIEPC